VHLRDFDFTLPANLIAQTPAARRDASRLMVVDRRRHSLQHDGFANIGDYLCAGDVLVVNDTRVIPARLRGRKTGTGGSVEVLLLHEVRAGAWEVLLKPAAKVPAGTEVEFGGGALRGRVGERAEHGAAVLHFTPPDVLPALAEFGEVPLPPYIQRQQPAESRKFDLERYQTVYARHPGAVAAPTAGLHFTPELLADLENQGVQQATLTLHVGWGTFQPVRSDAIEQHRMGRERYQLSASEAERIEQARELGNRVVAVGTTTTRTLETIGQQTGRVHADSGWSELFIKPGHRFRVIDALITNFHLPRSTLFMLVCAFAGRDLMLKAYQSAIANRYRFYSYGDAMLIM
jgi:S-adenosylmethionine:tRNA ribosyltransferase-isomerase